MSDYIKSINFQELIELTNESSLVSKTDAKGTITYVNEKFIKISGWSKEELIGANHNIVRSGFHDKEFWQDMYRTTIKDKKIWNKIVTNKNKNGKLYYVDTFIKAHFKNNKLIGFISVRQDVTSIVETLNDLNQKNGYLEHAAKILRHDMHSGINVYIPRGVASLERRLTEEVINKLKLNAPIKLIKEGLEHTQKVYKGVKEFTNLVKNNSTLDKNEYDLKSILNHYLSTTAYKDQIIINDLISLEVNESLFCTAIDNLIRNGLKYNDSENKLVKIYMDQDYLCVEDNGRGMTPEEFETFSKPYARKAAQSEPGTGLGLNISLAILKEHNFTVECHKIQNNIGGTIIKIKLR